EGDIQTHVDWETIALNEEPLCDEDIEGAYAHVAYKVMTKDRSSTLIFLLRHLWQPDVLLYMHTLEYITKVFSKHAFNKPPLLLQLTLYNGEVYPYPHPQILFKNFDNPTFARAICTHQDAMTDTPENSLSHPRTVFDYYEDAAFAKKIFCNAHCLIDYRDYSDEELASYEHVGILALAMKHVNDPKLSDWMKANKAIIQKLKASPYAHRAWEYLFSS
ncbi:MAG: Rpn family recombination-promoting nuclease/putative transposase, partial [Bacteroidota bacterium]